MRQVEAITPDREVSEKTRQCLELCRERLEDIRRSLSASGDRTAQTIFADLARCPSMEEIVIVLDRLLAHVEARSSRGAEPPEPVRRRMLVRL